MNKVIRCFQGDKKKNPIAKCCCHQFLTMDIKRDFVHIKENYKNNMQAYKIGSKQLLKHATKECAYLT